MPNLLSLPAELLCQIADHVYARDLIDMRLACKPLRDASNKPFGITYFTNRRHVPSLESVEALLEVAAHPTLGRYVKSVSMIAVFPVLRHPSDVDASDDVAEALPKAFVNSKSYMHLMKQVFTKILEHRNSVHISICDSATRSEPGWDDLESDPYLIQSPCHPATLDNTLLAAILANCHVQTLELSLHHHKFDRLHDALEDLLSLTRPPLKLIIHCPSKRTRVLRFPYTIIYDQADQSLKLEGCDIHELALAKAGATIKRTLGFLLSQSIHLILERCHLCSERDFAAFLVLDESESLSQNLSSVRMQKFRPCRSGGASGRRHWSGIFESLSGFVGLKYFVIQGLLSPSDWDLFHNSYTNGKWEAKGEGVAEQLEAMAALVSTKFVREVWQPDNLPTEGAVDGPDVV
jgi:hypothetical protein